MFIFPALEKEGDRKKEKRKKKKRETRITEIQKKQASEKKEAAQFIWLGFHHCLKHILILTSWEMHWFPAFSVYECVLAPSMLAIGGHPGSPDGWNSKAFSMLIQQLSICLLYPHDAEALPRPPVHTAHTVPDLVIPPLLGFPKEIEDQEGTPTPLAPGAASCPLPLFLQPEPQLCGHSALNSQLLSWLVSPLHSSLSMDRGGHSTGETCRWQRGPGLEPRPQFMPRKTGRQSPEASFHCSPSTQVLEMGKAVVTPSSPLPPHPPRLFISSLKIYRQV